MKRDTYLFENNHWNKPLNSALDSNNTLVICFGSSDYKKIDTALIDLQNVFKKSIIIGCSTSGEIYEDELFESSLSIAVIKFEKTSLKLKSLKIENSSSSNEIGSEIISSLKTNGLKSIFILSDGLAINGSKLTKSINASLDDKDIIVTGGLAGDDDRFEKTWVLVDGRPCENYITAVGFYGDNISVKSSSYGGWSSFGINRVVTSSKDNILYSLDDKPALDVYKTYLGQSAKDLPASGLLYPLMIKEDGYEEAKIRTILSVNEEDKSITFAGDITSNSTVMFMKAGFNDLIEAAGVASRNLNYKESSNEALCILISCVGRKLVLGQKTEDEIELVLDNLGENVKQVGYYSYGEISPLNSGECDLHNQTMTLTLIEEF